MSAVRRSCVFVLASAIGLAVPSLTLASPITWTWAGFNTREGIPEIPVGTLVTASWTLNPAARNECTDGRPGGFYFGQEVAITVYSLVGPVTYSTVNGALHIDAILPSACFQYTPGSVEFRLPFLTGPNLPQSDFFVPFPFPTGLYWNQTPSEGAFPTVMPSSVYLDFLGFRIRTDSHRAQGVSAQLTAVPEPGTLLLVTIGGLSLLWGSRRQRRSHSVRAQR